ncbi:MAG: type II secretion system F family protein [Clostridia bacterium]|nr:type II secretion system F family protein [Clostridia bacterium]
MALDIFNKKTQKVSAAELSVFCSQIALILESGLPLYDGMETLAETGKDSANADMYTAASNGVNEHGSLYEALKADDRWPEYLVEMVGIGEQSGQLEQVMKGLSDFYAREDRIRSSVTNAITYPLALGAMLVVIVLIMLIFVLPVFRRVLASMGVGVTESSSALMNIGAAVGWIVLVLIALVGIGTGTVLMLLRTRHREKVLEWIMKVFPPIRNISRKLSSARVASVLSMMLSSGFPTGEALRMTAKVLTDQEAAKKVDGIRTSLEEAESFADAIKESGLFEGLHERMIRMGVATGREDQVMQKISVLYEEQVEDGITRLISVIEPSLVALMSLVIGAVLLSVTLPMIGILSSML